MSHHNNNITLDGRQREVKHVILPSFGVAVSRLEFR